MPHRRQILRIRRRSSGIDLSRRHHLLALSAATAGAALGTGNALAQAASCVLTEDAGEGPFYLDTDLVRAEVVDGQPGAPLEIAFAVTRARDCAPLTRARVDLWQANAVGLYSGYEGQQGVGGIAAEAAVGQQWLRGTQLTDSDGRVRFRTIYPSWYGGRTPHLHFKVWVGGDEVVASQAFFPDETSAFVYESFEPYREHVAKRRVFNGNDPLHEGIYCGVDAADNDGVRATAIITVEEA
jgi:protocatechuate 3,4-dioxygenase beta subunit